MDAAAALRDNEQYLHNKARFREFLDVEIPNQPLSNVQRLEMMTEDLKNRFVFNFNDLREFDADLARTFLQYPFDCLAAFEEAVREATEVLEEDYFRKLGVPCRVGVDGNFGSHQVSPRYLNSDLLNQLVCVEGIITRCSLIRPKVVASVQYCKATHNFVHREFRDYTAYTGPPTSVIYPQNDDAGNPLTTDFGLSKYRDHQMLTLQEMPETAPAGQLPRSVEVMMEDDLVDSLKPGDRANIIGTYRALPSKSGSTSNGVFRTLLIAHYIAPVRKQAMAPRLTDADVFNIRTLAQKPDVFDIVSQSIAPSIYGHEHVKKALLLMMLGGVERNLATGTHIRGDINVLLVGDPSTAKSQMLRFIINTAPLVVSTTGRGSTGVGLTAAVGTDSDSGERQLQAGAMVLADRGIVCIDEFDKMSEPDRVAMHEVMEQQTVTIAKAGVHTSLNARCSVVAAANPVYGQYNRDRDPAHNIALPISLLSRFDLLFIVLDSLGADRDREISKHVLRLHSYRGVDARIDDRGNANDMLRHDVLNEAEAQDGMIRGGAPVYQPYNPELHSTTKLLTTDFLKKYVSFAKTRIRPILSNEATVVISEAYSELRQRRENTTLPITPRSLECLIRLSTAHAKCRLSNVVDQVDAQVAIDLLNFALFLDNQMMAQVAALPRRRRNKGVKRPIRAAVDATAAAADKKKQKKKKAKRARPPGGGDAFDFEYSSSDDGSSGGEEMEVASDGDQEDGEGSEGAEGRQKRRKKILEEEKEGEEDKDEGGSDEDEEEDAPERKRARVEESGPAQRLQDISNCIREAFTTNRTDTLRFDTIMRYMRRHGPQDVTEEELQDVLSKLHEQDKLMYVDPHVILL